MDALCERIDLPTKPVHDTADVADSASHSDWIYDARWSADGKTAVTAGRDGTVRVWDVASGKNVRIIDVAKLPPLAKPPYGSHVRAARFIGDGRAIVVTADSHPVRIFDVASGSLVAEVPYTHRDKDWNSPPLIETTKAELVVLSGYGSDVVVYDARTKAERYRLPNRSSDFVRLAVYEPGGLLATTRPGRDAGRDRSVFIQLRKLETGELLWEVEANGSRSADALAFSRDGKQLAATVEGTAFVLSIPDKRLAATVLLYPTFGRQEVTFSADGKRLVTGSRYPELWDIATGQRVRHFGPFSDLCHSVEISPDGKYLLTSHIGSDACIWEIETGRFFRRLGRDVYPAR